MSRRLLALAALAAMLVLPGVAAAAQDGLGVRIREAELERDGSTRVVVSVSGEAATQQVLPATSFQVTEEGRPLGDVAVQPLLESETLPVAIALLMDVSGSTEGEPLAAARTAATAFVDELLARGAQVALIAFGPAVEVRAGLTTQRDPLVTAIDGLEAGGETALYDAVVTATELLAETEGLRHVVVFSDGADTVSSASLDGAVGAAEAVGTPVTSVVLVTPDLDEAALRSLAVGTGGRTLPVQGVTELAGAFEDVVREIASQYVLTYRAEVPGPEELELSVSVTLDGARATDTITLLNTREPAVVAPPELPAAPVQEPLLGVFASPTGRMVGLGAAFLSALLLLGVLLWRPGQGKAARALERGMRLYEKGEVPRDHWEVPTADLTRRAIELVERVPKPEGFDDRVQLSLDRAAWPMRSSEFVLLTVASALLGGLVGFGLTGRLLAALVLAAAGGVVPAALLRLRVRQRLDRFTEQLPTTLQLLAGSLQAGYGILQAIDTVVQESEDPTGPEFARVLTEARLGMPLEEALEGMADRLDSEDFRWIVMAITIQRQVGGNLAELLRTVADTMRGRAQVRRQVRVLSAEGRISAAIIALMPFILTLALLVINPGYLTVLFQEQIGRILLVTSGVLMLAGFVWLRRIVDIEV